MNNSNNPGSNRDGNSVTCVAHTSIQGVEQHPEATSTVHWATTNMVRNFSKPRKEILLQCALGAVSHPDEMEYSAVSEVCMLFDNCSQRTYITANLSLRLGLPFLRKEQLILKTFTDKEGKLRTLDVVQFCVWGNEVKVYVEALVVPFICSKLHIPPLDGMLQRYEYLQCLDLANPPTPEHDVDILLGLDYY